MGGSSKCGIELGDCVGCDHSVGVDADVDFFVQAIERVVERGGLAFVALGENLHAARSDFIRIGGALPFRRCGPAIRRQSR